MPAAAKRRDARVADVVEVVDRHRPQLGRQLGASHVAQLVGVQLGQQPVLDAGLEHAAALLDREGPLLAEGVAEPGQLVLGRRRDHLLHHHLHVVVGPVGVLHRHRMRRQQRRHHVDGVRRADVPVDLQKPQLLIQGQTVAALGLDRGHPVAQEVVQPPAGQGAQHSRRRRRGWRGPCS